MSYGRDEASHIVRYPVNAIPVRLVLWTLVSALLGCTDRVSTQSVDVATAFIAGDAACVIDAGDEAWLKAAPAAWSLVERDALRLEPSQTKAQYIFYDVLCSYHSADGESWEATSHGGDVSLPDGDVVPPVVASFAAPGLGGEPFMAMALPTIWRAQGVTSDLGLENMLFAVFVHEMAHTRQFYAYGPKLDELTARWALPEDFNDDAVQERFAGDPGFSASVDRERDLLYAALETDDETALATAREALELIESRRARWYAGEDEKYKELEDVFLTLEGVGNFAGYAWLVHAQGGAAPPAAALEGMRRGGRRWSQDEGMAVFLILERLNPQWTEYAFAIAPKTALELLAEAVENG